MGTDRSRQLRVVVADDHVAMRRTLCEELAGSGFEVCGQAANADDAIAVSLRARPDLCLLDVVMPHGNGIAAARALADALPATRVVIITSAPREDDALAAQRAGASGYLAKHDDPRELPRVLRLVAEPGCAFQSPWLERMQSAR